MHDDSERAVLDVARRAARAEDAPLLLAVSGGLDSMTLLHAMASVNPARVAGVATFDHRTGPASAQAAALVQAEAARLGIAAVVGRLDGSPPASDGRESMWRAARYRFLRAAAAERGARLVTAHTRDDQVETVLMRVLRGSGARGLAGLAVRGDVLRPFLELGRQQVERYAAAVGLEWMEDPSNSSREFLRNRVRHDLLPALRRADPGIDAYLLELGGRSAAWRVELESVVDRLSLRRASPTTIAVCATELRACDEDSLHVLWGALAGRVGLSLDWRGTRRCAEFTMKDPLGGSMPLSGGWVLEARRGELILGRRPNERHEVVVLPEQGSVRWGEFRFRVAAADEDAGDWGAELPSSSTARVRGWSSGDRLAATGSTGPRRVKRYLSDARVVGLDRARWPVVELGAEVVWIPGVRRSDAATARSGRPGRHYVCERTLG